jgi:hypothetical protein
MGPDLRGGNFPEPFLEIVKPKQPKLGRPSEVDPEKLRRNVIELAFALEENWGEVGWQLRQAETLAEVRAALRNAVNPRCRLLEPLIDDQIREPDQIREADQLRDATPAELAHQLRELRGMLSDSMQRHRKNLEALQDAHNACEHAFDAWIEETDPVKQAKIQMFRPSLACLYQEAEVLEHASRLEREGLERELKEREAYFVQSEILRFVHSDRCGFRPSNVARAIAGLPLVTARVSFEECVRRGIDPPPGTAFEIFQVIERVYRRSIDELERSINSAREFLVKRRKDPPTHVAELRKNWYFLESAIRSTAREIRGPLDSLPYCAFAEYRRSLSSQSATESVLANAQRLVVPGDHEAPQRGPDWGPPRKYPRTQATYADTLAEVLAKQGQTEEDLQ